MEDNALAPAYINNNLCLNTKRFFAHVFDAIVLIILHVILLLSSMAVFQTTDDYKTAYNNINSAANGCYALYEKSKLAEFTGVGEDKYNNPIEYKTLVNNYIFRHILLSYDNDPSLFIKEGINIDNPDKLEKASYENDNIAFFFSNYVENNNTFEGKENDIVDLKGKTTKAFFYEKFKTYYENYENYWLLDEVDYALPILNKTTAFDTYYYMKVDTGYIAGKNSYEYLYSSFGNYYNYEDSLLNNSSRYQVHYKVYEENYAHCSYVVVGCVFLSYIVSYLLGIILPQLISHKKHQTIGKKIFKIAPANKKYDYLEWHNLLRKMLLQGITYLGAALFSSFLVGGTSSGLYITLFKIGSLNVSCMVLLAMCAIISLISGLSSLIRKDNASLVDLASGVLVVDISYQDIKKIIKNENEQQTKEIVDSSIFNKNKDIKN